MRRIYKVRALWGCIVLRRNLLILGTLLAFSNTGTDGQTISATAGAVRKVEGDVFYHCHDKNITTRPSVGSVLHDDDFVQTGPNGSIVLGLNPDTYLLISADTLVKAKQTNLENMHFDLDRGEVFLFSKGFGKGASLTLHTPPKPLEIIKGGSYRIAVKENGETEANVIRGELRYSEGTGQTVKVKAGKAVNFVRRAKGQASN
jgi:hypothetical protein